MKKLHQSLCKINQGFDQLDFDTWMDFLVKIMVAQVKVPTTEEVNAVMTNKVPISKMREKILKFVNEKKNLYLNYLQNYRIC